MTTTKSSRVVQIVVGTVARVIPITGVARYISFPVQVVLNWLLATGFWNDSGTWDDSANWID